MVSCCRSRIHLRRRPLLGYFPTGFDPQRRGSKVGETKVRVFRNLKWPGRLELAVHPTKANGSAANVEFVGSSYAGEAAQPQVCTYALGVLDKEKQTLRVMPIAANKIFRLEPRVLGKASSSSEAGEEARIEELNAGARGEKIRQLTNLYGAKRDKDITTRYLFLMELCQQNFDVRGYLVIFCKTYESSVVMQSCVCWRIQFMRPLDMASYCGND